VTAEKGNYSILGAKLLKSTLRFVMSVRMKRLDLHWTDFHEILYLMIFRKYVLQIQVLFKLDKNKGYFT
jgi:hypothetical protein